MPLSKSASSAVRRPVPFHYDMRVRTRPSERTHSRQRWAIGIERPVHHSRSHPQRQPVPVHVRVRIAEMQMLGDHAPLHRQHGFDQARNPRRWLQMADIGLHRADQQRLVRFSSPAVHRRRRAYLNRVAHLRPRPVRLQVIHFHWQSARPRQCLLDHALLRRPVRHRQSLARAILIYRRSPDHAPDPVAICLCLVEPLQDHYPAALAPHKAVGGRVKRLALPVRRQHPGIAPQFGQPPGKNRLYPTRQCQVRFSPLQVGSCLVHRNQRRRTSRIYCHRRPLQPQCEGYPPDGRVQRGARDREEAGGRLGSPARAQDHTPVIVVADPGVHPRAAALQPLRVHSRVFKGLPTRL